MKNTDIVKHMKPEDSPCRIGMFYSEESKELKEKAQKRKLLPQDLSPKTTREIIKKENEINKNPDEYTLKEWDDYLDKKWVPYIDEQEVVE